MERATGITSDMVTERIPRALLRNQRAFRQ